MTFRIPNFRLIYSLVAPFPSLTDQIVKTDLIHFGKDHTAAFPAEKLLLDPVTLKLLQKIGAIPTHNPSNLLKRSNAHNGMGQPGLVGFDSF
jgi:hypothetical protein